MSEAPKKFALGLIPALALALLIPPAPAFGFAPQYANGVLRGEYSVAASGVVGTHRGGTARVSTSVFFIYAVAQTRSATTYAVLMDAEAPGGGTATLNHHGIANSWSTCMWYADDGKHTPGTLALTCTRR